MAKILLVEDDEFISRMINMRLTLRKHQVELAFNGQQAVEKAPAGDFDLVLMDMHMPVMDGHQATRKLRESGYGGLIIAVTASVMSADSQKAIKSGCDNYISKPIGADFEDRIEAILKSSELHLD
ncbi:MAG: response regulator [Gammaproteobacteria bacterium]|nr:response regulator [Gammaproteobacteria bacterium]